MKFLYLKRINLKKCKKTKEIWEKKLFSFQIIWVERHVTNHKIKIKIMEVISKFIKKSHCSMEY
jgi:hypothetical protein